MRQQGTVKAIKVVNPWLLPEPPVATPDAPQEPLQLPVQQNSGRFVTPDVLRSLKQQQQLYQVMPENRPRYRQYNPRPQQYVPRYPSSGIPGIGSYSLPLFGPDITDPLYDVPAVSPWGDGANLIYRGGTMPLVPDEAVGGLPPIYVPPQGIGDGSATGDDNTETNDDYKVFNPFTFLPQ